MTKQYIGHLSYEDPLYNYLQYDIMPQMGGSSDKARYRVFRLSGTNNVYLYEEKYSYLSYSLSAEGASTEDL